MFTDFTAFKDLLFNENEWTCFGNEVTVTACKPLFLLSTDHSLVGLNPMIESRRDNNVQTFRNILIELDSGSINEQQEYIKDKGLPYSSAVFSGKRSVHHVISLEKPLPDLKSYKFICKWILNILEKADHATVNPSKFTRVPGATRSPSCLQELLDLRSRISREELNEWLNNYPSQRPKENIQRPSYNQRNFKLPKLAIQWLSENDFPEGERNSRWFWIACRCKDAGFTFEETIHQLSDFFVEEMNFSSNEWQRALESAYKQQG